MRIIISSFAMFLLLVIYTFVITNVFADGIPDNILQVERVEVSEYIVQNKNKENGENLLDMNLNTAWQYKFKAEQKTNVSFYFKEPVTIRSVILFNGYGKRYDLYKKNGKIKQIICSAGERSQKINVQTDIYNYQELKVHFQQVTKLNIQIEQVEKGSLYNDIALSEIAFWGQGPGRIHPDLSGSLPVIIEEIIPKSAHQKDNYRSPFEKHGSTKDIRHLFWSGFYSIETGTVRKMHEGINQIKPVPHQKKYLMTLSYWGWAPGAFHPYYATTYLFKPEDSPILSPLTNKIGNFILYNKVFRGESRKGSMLSYEAYDKPQEYYYYNYTGTLIDRQKKPLQKYIPASRQWNVRYDVTSGIVSGVTKKWTYQSNIKHGTFYYLGKGLYALVEKANTGNCCKICRYSSKVIFFNSKGVYAIKSFPADKRIYPFQIALHEDPCSA